MFALAKENRELWTRPDTVAAIRQMHETTHKPLIYQASDASFRISSLKDQAYFMLAPVDETTRLPKIEGNRIASDSIVLVAEHAAGGQAIHVQGFAECSMASIFSASDQTWPGILLTLSMLSMAAMAAWRRRMPGVSEAAMAGITAGPTLDGIKLTPMQRRLAQMLLDAPDMKVDKRTLCEALWGNKSNAEESLYTLVKRTKGALAKADIEIVCNRGDSYELRVNG